MIEYRELIAMLHFARTMSSFGPDFEDDLAKRAWHNKLKDLPMDHLKKALNALTGNREFPAANEIVDFCKDLNNTSDLPVDQAFALLWGKIGSVGSYSHPEFPNEIGLAVERLGGWKQICHNWTEDKREWHYKAFCEIYGTVTESKARGMLPTSRYALGASKEAEPKQIPDKVAEALRMATSAAEPSKPKLRGFLKELRSMKKK